MAEPAVSVIIAVKNAARFLGECLESIGAQTFTDYEIVVVDGHSTDATEVIARGYSKVRFFQQTGTGFADAWNCGLRWSKAPLVAFIDSDDVWTRRKLEQQVRRLAGEPALEAVVGRMRFVLEPGETAPKGFRPEVLGHDHVAHMPGVLLARRSLFEALGDWGEGWVVANDIDWFLKLRDSGRPVGVIDDLLLKKRVHSRNFSYLTAADPVYPRELLRLLRASVLRKRAAASGPP